MQRNYDMKYLEELRFLLKDVKNKSFELINRDIQNLTVLDVGCGDGADCRNISDLLGQKSFKIYGIDKDAAFIQKAQDLTSKHLYPQVEFICGLADRLPFKDGSIDVIRLERVFQHLTNPKEVMAECYRLLNKKTGKIIIIDTDWLSVSFGTKFYEIERRIIDEKVHHDINNGLACRCIVDYLHGLDLKVRSMSSHITYVDTFEKADYIMGVSRNVERITQKDQIDFDPFFEEINKLETRGGFSFSWVTKIFEIC